MDYGHDHLGLSKTDGYITFDNGKNEIRIGRFINKIIKKHIHDNVQYKNIKDTDVESFVEHFQRTINYIISNKKRNVHVIEGDDIWKIYQLKGEGGTLGSSCMFGKCEKILRLYTDSKSGKIKMATVWDGEPFESRLMGRAILWHDCYSIRYKWSRKRLFINEKGHNVMDRIYYTNKMAMNELQDWGIKNGYHVVHGGAFLYKNKRVEKNFIFKLDNTVRLNKVPYLDTFSHLDLHRRLLFTTSTRYSTHRLTHTDGTASQIDNWVETRSPIVEWVTEKWRSYQDWLSGIDKI